MLVNSILIGNLKKKLVVLSSKFGICLLYDFIILLDLFDQMIITHYLSISIKILRDSFEPIKYLLLFLICFVVKITFISNFFSFLGDFFQVISIRLDILLVLLELAINAGILSINERCLFRDFGNDIVMRQIMKMLNDSLLISNKLGNESCVHLIMANDLLIVRLNREVLILLNCSLTNLVNCFSCESASIIFGVNFFIVMEMLRVLEPDLVDDVLVWNFETCVSREEHVNIMIIGEIVIRNRDLKARFKVLFACIWILEGNDELIVLSMNKERLILKVEFTATLFGIIEVVVSFIFKVTFNLMKSLRVCLRLLILIPNNTLLDVDKKTIKHMIKSMCVLT